MIVIITKHAITPIAPNLMGSDSANSVICCIDFWKIGGVSIDSGDTVVVSKLLNVWLFVIWGIDTAVWAFVLFCFILIVFLCCMWKKYNPLYKNQKIKTKLYTYMLLL